MSAGYIYIVGRDGGPYKIGMARDVAKRLRAFRVMPFVVNLIHKIETDDMRRLESYLHRLFAGKRVRGEWFNLTSDDLRNLYRFSRVYYGKDAALRRRLETSRPAGNGWRIEVQKSGRYWQWRRGRNETRETRYGGIFSDLPEELQMKYILSSKWFKAVQWTTLPMVAISSESDPRE